MNRIYLAAVSVAAMAVAAPATAAPVLTQLNTDLLAGPATVSFLGGSFTFSATRDFFSPLAIQTGGTGAVSAFGGFLGIPVSPTTNFTDRGTTVYGPTSGQFAEFTATTTVPFSNGTNFLGLRAAVGNDFYYGFAFTENSILRGFGFETSANTAITATTALSAAVPEPASWALMIVGFAAVGYVARRRAVQVRVAYA